MRFLDLFAGIGGFRLGMESAGHECVGFVEIDKYARQSYQAIHQTEGEWTANDITTVEKHDIESIGYVDVICAGFPCQPFSTAGQQRGFEDTRGTLFFDVARFASILRPKLLFLENVKGLLNHNKGETFRIILSSLESLGYDVEWQVLNSRHFGVPHNRQRIFIIGHFRGERTKPVFPVQRQDSKTNHREDRSIINTVYVENAGRIAGWVDRTDRLFAFQSDTKRSTAQEHVYIKRNGIPDAITVGHMPKLCESDYRLRKLTPRECWRLQGFPDWAFIKAKESGLEDVQLYKQAGNSVTVNVIAEIAKRLSYSH